jgi:hypothetical protein
MLIDRYFDQLFHNENSVFTRAFGSRPVPRIPSRLVRYGIIHTDTLRNTLDEFEPKFDPMMKRQAELMVEKLQAFIALMEEYEENTTDGPTEEDDKKAAAKAKAKPKRKAKS